VGGGGDGYCGYHGYRRYRYGFVTGHKIVTCTHTCVDKGVILATGYLYPCSSLDVCGVGLVHLPACVVKPLGIWETGSHRTLCGHMYVVHC